MAATQATARTASLQTFQYTRDRGWSCGPLPDLDGETVLVVACAAPEFADDETPLLDLARRFAGANVIGCSSAGEILGERMCDATVTVAAMRFSHTRLQRVSAPIWQSNSFPRTGDRAPAARAEARRVPLAEGLDVNGSEPCAQQCCRRMVVTGGLPATASAKLDPRRQRTGAQPRLCSRVHGDRIRVGRLRRLGRVRRRA
jgi:hypothetical protein